MTPLTPAEEGHLEQFCTTRADWRVCLLAERMHDENEGNREHKYSKAHPYITGMHYVMGKLKELVPCKVLDIGSPIAQNVAAGSLPGVDLTVLDVRRNDDAELLGLKWVTASATELPFPDASWELLTCLWVMGHVGDGRYGDAFDADGDKKLLAEAARVLKPDGLAIIGVGLIDSYCGNIFNLHRIYSWEWLRAAFKEAGFEVLEERDLFVSSDVFLDDTTKPERRDGYYGLALLRRMS